MSPPERYRVLLVEDNELDARVVSRALTGSGGCQVEWVADLAGGLEAVQRDAFDCVLVDLSLPDSDGLVSVETMVARTPQCPVVVLTGRDDPELALEAMSRGAQDYLVKNSITPELVVRSIRYAVARHSAETELLDVKQRLRSMHARDQIARDLHDTVIQRLYAAGLTMQAATRLRERDAVVERAQAAVTEIDRAIVELREAIFGLSVVESDEQFAIEVEAVARTFEDGLGFAPLVRLGELPPLPDELRGDLVAVVREALSNVTRHAAATTATVTIVMADDQLVLRVIDNGRGPGLIEGEFERGPSGNGLWNMRARARAHGGDFAISASPTGGCELVWTVPLP